jgi:hypothetical protein
MSKSLKLTGLLMTGILCLPIAGRADTPQTTHPTHINKKKATPPPPLPSGTLGPVPQVPLDSIPAVAPQVSYEDGLLTIVAPNSTLGDILRSVRKHTAAEIEVPATASERVVTRLGPAPARQVMAELLNGSRFNYILLGSPEDSNALVRVVLVAKTGPDTPDGQPAQAGNGPAPNPQAVNPAEAAEAEATEEVPEDTNDPNAAAEVEQPAPATDQPGPKTPQQLLQEMQQRQLQMQQQQPGAPGAFPPTPGLPRQPQPQPPQDQQ